MAANGPSRQKSIMLKSQLNEQWTQRALTPTMASATSFVFFVELALHIWSVWEWNISVTWCRFVKSPGRPLAKSSFVQLIWFTLCNLNFWFSAIIFPPPLRNFGKCWIVCNRGVSPICIYFTQWLPVNVCADGGDFQVCRGCLGFYWEFCG